MNADQIAFGIEFETTRPASRVQPRAASRIARTIMADTSTNDPPAPDRTQSDTAGCSLSGSSTP